MEVLTHKQMKEFETSRIKQHREAIDGFQNIVGDGPAMQEVYNMILRVATSSTTVMLRGETGTGKEMIAKAIHNSSSRRNKPMIKVNCAAIPVNLFESELFGHERGSFTGALERRIGKFEMANGGTLFLDEIGEMPVEMQVKLLRVLQEREVERIGGRTAIKIDVRIIAATNRALEEEVKGGRFRADLYYRLNVFPIHIPPLRERVEDIPALTSFFISRYSPYAEQKFMKLPSKVIQDLQAYSWPGNVRELEHLIERSILLSPDGVLRKINLPNAPEETEQPRRSPVEKTLRDFEREHIIRILKKCKGKIAGAGGAAELLKIPSTTLHSKIKKLGISKYDIFQKDDDQPMAFTVLN